MNGKPGGVGFRESPLDNMLNRGAAIAIIGATDASNLPNEARR